MAVGNGVDSIGYLKQIEISKVVMRISREQFMFFIDITLLHIINFTYVVKWMSTLHIAELRCGQCLVILEELTMKSEKTYAF